MSTPKSQDMSWQEMVIWSVLSGAFVTGFAVLAALVVRFWWNEFAFRDMSAMELAVYGAGIFAVGTLVVLAFLAKIKWIEEEKPADIVDQLERLLKG